MKPGRQRSLISMIFSYGAQLAYVEESRGVYELLSKADRLFRYINSRKSLIPLREELSIIETYIEIINICTPHSLEYHNYIDIGSYYVKKCVCLDLLDENYFSLTKENATLDNPLSVMIEPLHKNCGEIILQNKNHRIVASFPINISLEG